MKSIIFTTDPNSELVKKLQEKGSVTVAQTTEDGNAIKVLKAMKKLQVRGEYIVLADEESTKYLEVAKKMGYSGQEDPKAIEVLAELKKDYDTQITDAINKMESEYKSKLTVLEEETNSFKKIKQAIRKQIYG